MRCPYCHHEDTVVKDSRTTEDGLAIRRRRSCEKCDNRFTTFERIQLRELTVIKKDGTRVPFDRDKLARSISTALHKRPIPSDHIEQVISQLVRNLETSGETEIPTSKIGEMAIETLSALDPVAYVRFCSIYHEFQDVKDFVDFMSKMPKSMQHTPSGDS